MEFKEIFKFADDVILTKTGKHLNDLQRDILEETLQGHKYNKIADKHECSINCVREVAATLWKFLSEEVGEKITQSNIRTTLERANYSIISSNFYPNSKTHINICGNALDSQQTKQSRKQKISHLDLDDAPFATTFYGRTTELNTLENWILQQHFRLIAIAGMAGIGKTALTLQLIEQIKDKFNIIIWRNLRYFPTPEDLEIELIDIIFNQDLDNENKKGEDRRIRHKFRKMINLLREHRCLIILDNLQALFSDGQLAGNYQPQYQEYQAFFKSLGEVKHNSCFIVNTWETSQEITNLAENLTGIGVLPLGGLGEDAKNLLREKGLSNEEKWNQLISLYGGNPLYLKLVSTLINQLFNDQIKLDEKQKICFLPEELQNILNIQTQRLSPLEKNILIYLSTNDDDCSINELIEIFNLPENQIFNAIQSLIRRSFLKQNSQIYTSFTLTPVLKFYLKIIENSAI
jgi:DNA-binding CsgD family transcriptional regulator